MGTTTSSLVESAKDKKISREIQEKRKQDEEQIKLLLLGTGESGKSTIFKQMKILYGVPWTENELLDLRPTVYTNVITCVKQVLRRVSATGAQFATPELQRSAAHFLSDRDSPDDLVLTPQLGRELVALWNSPQVQQAWSNRSQFQVLDCLEYYMKEMDRIAAGAQVYVPTQQDVLQARVRTSGIVEEKFLVDGVPFVLYDVGGQRNERKKWVHAFEGMTSLIFVCAINEYDQVLFEDNRTSRMDEAFKVFAEIVCSPYFAKTSMILFLNKNDLFREKLQHVPFRVPGKRFEDFPGPHYAPGADLPKCIAAAQNYLASQFTKLKPDNKQMLYIHMTEATDTKQTLNVLKNCKEIIMRGSLKANGFIN